MFSRTLRTLRLVALLATGYLVLGSQPAEAGLPFGRYTSLTQVAVLKTGATDVLLCEARRTYHLAFIPAHRTMLPSAIAQGTCSVEAIATVATPEIIQMLHAQNLIPADVTHHPRLSLSDLVIGHSLPLILLVLLAFVHLRSLQAGQKRAARLEILGIQDPGTFAFIDAMCHAAIADGRASDEEIEYIQGVARDLTGLDYSDEHIRTAIDYCERLSRAAHFAQFGEDLSLGQRQMVMRGVLSVVMADGTLSRKEKAFVSNLVKGLKLSPSTVEAMLDKILTLLGGETQGAGPEAEATAAAA